MKNTLTTNKLEYFYNSYYKDNTTAYKPCVKVLFDNDLAGRDVYCKIKSSIHSEQSIYR